MQRRERSEPYPRRELESCLNFIKDLAGEFGSGLIPREAIRDHVGVRSTTSSSVSVFLSSSEQFGLLENVYGKGIKISDLSSRIIRGKASQEKDLNIIVAFLAPPLYRRVIREFRGVVLPSNLGEFFLRDKSMASKNAARAAANVFIKSGIFARAIIKNRINQNVHEMSNIMEAKGVFSPSNNEEIQLTMFRDEEKLISVPAVLPTGRKLELVLPEHLTPEDKRFIVFWLKSQAEVYAFEGGDKKTDKTV